jgi:hypothetical protein
MEGIFRSNDPKAPDVYWGSIYERCNEYDYWHNVILECDIGPFKAGEIISKANYSYATKVLFLSKHDDEDNLTDWYQCVIKTKYTPVKLMRTD